jgi:uncharacterized repeat protein (TIGR01451 family)
MNSLHNNIDLKNKAQSPIKAFGLAAVLVLGLAVQVTPAVANITNTATASGTYAGTTRKSNPASASVPVAPRSQSMVVTKTASKTLNAAAGDVITYTYKVTNNGNVTIKNITLADVHNAAGPAPVPGSEILTTDAPPLSNSTDATPANGVWSNLAPGDSITFTATYTVRQSDVDNLQ